MSGKAANLLAAAALAAGLSATQVRTDDAPGGPAAVPAPADAAKDNKPPGATQGPAERKEFTKEEIKAALLKAAANAAKKTNANPVQFHFGGQGW